MIRAARATAKEAGIQLRLIEGGLEDLPESVGTFDLVTIGRALHWLDRDVTLGVLDRVVAADGRSSVAARGRRQTRGSKLMRKPEVPGRQNGTGDTTGLITRPGSRVRDSESSMRLRSVTGIV
jgi:hypothetical protein